MRFLITVVMLGFFLGCATQPPTKCDQTHPKRQQFAQAICRVCYGNQIDAHTTHFCIVPRTDIVNAWIDAKSNIFISQGLLDQLEADDGMMCVIAHELSHYALNHIPKRQAVSLGVDMVFQIANIFIPGVGWGNLLVNPLVTNTYSRDQEIDADRNAVKMMENAAVQNALDPYVGFLSWMRSKKGEGNRWDLFATHPPLEDRIAALTEEKLTAPLDVPNPK